MRFVLCCVDRLQLRAIRGRIHHDTVVVVILNVCSEEEYSTHLHTCHSAPTYTHIYTYVEVRERWWWCARWLIYSAQASEFSLRLHTRDVRAICVTLLYIHICSRYIQWNTRIPVRIYINGKCESHMCVGHTQTYTHTLCEYIYIWIWKSIRENTREIYMCARNVPHVLSFNLPVCILYVCQNIWMGVCQCACVCV